MKKILPVCFTIVLIATAGGWSASPSAVDIELFSDESSIYILYSDGYIQTSGFAVSRGYLASTSAVDMKLTQSGKGYYVLEKDGNLDNFGDAVEISSPMKDTKIPFVEMELYSTTNNPYFLKQDGSIVTVGSTILYGDLTRAVKAVDLELTEDGLGYYVLYEDGLIAFFGTAVDRGYTVTSSIKAVGLELTDNGYYVALADGSIFTFGDAFPLPFKTLPDNNVVDMVLSDQGYRVLTKDGEVHDFIQIESQGSSDWYAKVTARSVSPQATATSTPTPTATPTPTRTPKADVAYFKFTTTGFTEKIVGKIPDGSTLPNALDSGYASLFTGGLFVAAADGADLPSRKILYYSLKDSTSKTSTGTVFATIAAERGAAVIRGMAYSKSGLYVVVQDDSGTYVFLIQGGFENADVQGFSLF